MKQEWISPSEYASRIHKSSTYVYSLIKQGKVKYQSFKRGQYNGYLLLWDKSE